MKHKQPSKKTRCPCGSGKRYVKCCKKNTLSKKDIDKVIEIFREREEKQKEFTHRYGHILPPNAININGKAMFSIGSSIYTQTREGPYTFLHMIHDHALEFFGVEYLKKEEKKEYKDRHPAIQWMQISVDHIQALESDNCNDSLPEAIGAVACWYRFAFDLYTIRNNSTLEVIMRERLSRHDEFQGARHELWVASLFVAAGFDIEYEDETDNTVTHPEFIATHRDSGIKIAVEAKSKHRKGIKGFNSGKAVQPGDSVNIRGLVLDAYKKETSVPLYVFIDLNLPPATDEDWVRWNEEIETTMNDLGLEGYVDPCDVNIVFFHNDPSHYLCREEIGGELDKLWIRYFVAKSTRIDHPEIDICELVLKAHRQRAAPPEDFIDWG